MSSFMSYASNFHHQISSWHVLLSYVFPFFFFSLFFLFYIDITFFMKKSIIHVEVEEGYYQCHLTRLRVRTSKARFISRAAPRRTIET